MISDMPFSWLKSLSLHYFKLCMFSSIILQLFKKSDFFKNQCGIFFNIRYVGWIPNVLLL